VLRAVLASAAGISNSCRAGLTQQSETADLGALPSDRHHAPVAGSPVL